MTTNTVDISDFVAAELTIAPNATPFQNFGLILEIGDSTVIDVNERYRIYATLSQVTQDFGPTAPETLAAQVVFGQSPQPAQVMIGRWARVATPGLLHGASLTPTQQVLSNFTTVTTGAFFIMLNGIPYAVTGLNFASALNLSGVASALQTGLQTATSLLPTASYNGTLNRFNIGSMGPNGLGATVSYGAAPTAVGSAAFSAQPSVNDTLILGGTTITFVSGTPTGNQVQISSVDLPHTLQNLLTFVNASTDVNISKNNYTVVSSGLYYWCKTPGTGGNSFTTTKVSTVITLSGATMTGGSGTDISTLLGLTQAAGASPPVPGINAETPLQAVAILANANSQWYQAAFASSVMPSNSDFQAIAAFINGLARKRIFGVTINTTDCLDPTNSSDLASLLQSLNIPRVFWWYDPSNPYGVFSMMGRAATINFGGSNTTITLAYKVAPGLLPAFLTETQFATLQGKGGNCNIAVNNGAVMIYPGQMSNATYFGGQLTNGNWFDEIQNCDWFLNFVQTNVFNALFGATTKIPQTDAGDNIIATYIAQSCQQAVVNGMSAPGEWTGPGFGSLQTFDTLSKGYYIYYPPIATQASADRASRKSVPFQIAIKLAGAIHTVDLLITVNR